MNFSLVIVSLGKNCVILYIFNARRISVHYHYRKYWKYIKKRPCDSSSTPRPQPRKKPLTHSNTRIIHTRAHTLHSLQNQSSVNEHWRVHLHYSCAPHSYIHYLSVSRKKSKANSFPSLFLLKIIVIIYVACARKSTLAGLPLPLSRASGRRRYTAG